MFTKLLLAIALTVSPVIGFAQSNTRIITATGIDGVAYKSNYIINNNFQKNTNNVTTSGTGVGTPTKNTDPTAIYDGADLVTSFSDAGGKLIISSRVTQSGDRGLNCSAEFRYRFPSESGAHPNDFYAYVQNGAGTAISPRLTLSSTYDNILVFSEATKTAQIPMFACPTADNINVVIEKVSTTSSYNFWIDEVMAGPAYFPTSVPQGAVWVGSLKYDGAANCIWTRTNTALGSFAADTDCSTPTVAGSVTAPGTKIPAFVIANAEPGNYYVVANSLFLALTGSTTSSWAFNDGITTVFAGNTVAGTAPDGVNNLTGNFRLTTQQTNWTVNIFGASSSGDVNINANTSGLRGLTFDVYRFPLAGQSNDIVPASCINNPDCQNSFSAKITAGGVVSDENYPFINGNCSASTPYTCTFDTSRFSAAPNCVIQINQSGGTATNMTAISASAISYITFSTPAQAATNQGVNITCDRTGSDIRSWGPALWLNGGVTSNSSGSMRMEAAYITNSGTCVISAQTSNWITAIARPTAGQCDLTLTGTFGANPICITQQHITGPAGTTTMVVNSATSVSTYSGNNGFGAADRPFMIFCFGAR